MNIGDVAAASGLPAKTIRYYEDIGLIRPSRSPNGYRAFGDADVRTLAFVGRARRLGFTIEECRALLALHGDQARASGDVKQVVEAHIGEIARRIAELEGMRATLAALARRCHGDTRPDCPILDDLAGDRPAAPPRRAAVRASRRPPPASGW